MLDDPNNEPQLVNEIPDRLPRSKYIIEMLLIYQIVIVIIL